MFMDKSLDSEIIEKLTAFFDAKPEIILAMLYGSCSRGTETNRSDVDIAVAMAEALPLDDRLSLQLELSLLLKREVDLVDIRKITGLLHYKVFTEGVCVKKKQSEGSALLHSHTMVALYWYEDYYPIYKRGQTCILERAFNRKVSGNSQ